MTLRIGVSTPWGLWDLPPSDRRLALESLAAHGVDHIVCADHVTFRNGSGTDALVQLAALTGIEPRLGAFAGVYLLALRHPVVAARAVATLGESALDVTVGVGVGGEDRHEIEAVGVDPSTRGRRTDVALDAVRRLLAGEEVSGDGEFFDFESVIIRPTPAPPVRFVVGGRSDAALRRAGALGDGWLAAWVSPRRFVEGCSSVERTAAEHGRTSVAWQHGLQTWVGVGDDADDGRSHVAAAMRRFYGLPFEPFERYTPVGNPADVAEQLLPYVEAGARVINLTPCGKDRPTELASVGEIAARLRAAISL